MIKKLLLKNSRYTAPADRDKYVTEFILCKEPHNIISNVLIIVAVFMCALLFTACNKKQPQVPASEPSQLRKPIVLPKPVQKQVSSTLRVFAVPANQFDFSNKKDPFKPFIAVKLESKNSPDALKRAQRNSLPIHSFDVNQFKLIGVITGGRENKAMVTDPAGKGYVLKVGMLIGKNDGRITSISSNGVVVLEQFKDDNGRVRKENIKLTLPRKQ